MPSKHKSIVRMLTDAISWSLFTITESFSTTILRTWHVLIDKEERVTAASPTTCPNDIIQSLGFNCLVSSTESLQALWDMVLRYHQQVRVWNFGLPAAFKEPQGGNWHPSVCIEHCFEMNFPTSSHLLAALSRSYSACFSDELTKSCRTDPGEFLNYLYTQSN